MESAAKRREQSDDPAGGAFMGRRQAAYRRIAMCVLLCWLGSSIVWLTPAYATTGVALYLKDFAVIAVDGRVNKVGPLISGHQSECKLSVANGKGAVVAGLVDEPDAGYDVTRILHNVLNQSLSVAGAADLVQKQLQQRLPGALQAFQKQNPGAFQARAGGSIQLLLAGMGDTGQIQVARRSVPYDPTRTPQGDDGTGVAEHVGVALIGETAAIDLDLIRLQKTNGWEGMGNPTDLEKLARRFIALEVVAKPQSVGPPISMLLIDDSGLHWVEPGTCTE